MVYSRRFGARIRAQAAAHYHGQKNAHERARRKRAAQQVFNITKRIDALGAFCRMRAKREWMRPAIGAHRHHANRKQGQESNDHARKGSGNKRNQAIQHARKHERSGGEPRSLARVERAEQNAPPKCEQGSRKPRQKCAKHKRRSGALDNLGRIEHRPECRHHGRSPKNIDRTPGALKPVVIEYGNRESHASRQT